jgi:drug/metabolite transporter (DMT)-like permease
MNEYTKGALITAAGVVIISPDTLLIRLIDADAWTQLFWRGILAASAVLLGYAVLTGRQFSRHMRAMGLPGVVIAAVFSCGTACFMYSADNTLIANTLFITATSPVFAAILSWLFLGEKVSLRTMLTIIASLCGIAIIAAGSVGEGAAQASLGGDLAALGAAIALAVTFTIARKHKTASMVPAMGIAGYLSAMMGFFLAPDLVIPEGDWLWMALMGALVVPLGFALMTTGPRYLPAPDVSLLLLLEAVLGPLIVWAVLAEFPGVYTLVGGGVVLGALFISNLTRRTRG